MASSAPPPPPKGALKNHLEQNRPQPIHVVDLGDIEMTEGAEAQPSGFSLFWQNFSSFFRGDFRGLERYRFVKYGGIVGIICTCLLFAAPVIIFFSVVLIKLFPTFWLAGLEVLSAVSMAVPLLMYLKDRSIIKGYQPSSGPISAKPSPPPKRGTLPTSNNAGQTPRAQRNNPMLAQSKMRLDSTQQGPASGSKLRTTPLPLSLGAKAKVFATGSFVSSASSKQTAKR